ncbi:hypothetical protein HK104_010102 [Borealophlyctis nickersoniae]|nr:hypothetical protein HK104_010102 [Borealophlyctis nickersoniae]
MAPSTSTKSASPTITLLIVCPDKVGIVASLTGFITTHGGNLVDVDFHTDHEENLFLGRLEWDQSSFSLPRETLHTHFSQLCDPFGGRWSLHFSDTPQKVAVFVSLQDHCLLDLIWRGKEFGGEVALVVSNHETLREKVEKYGIPFHVFKITSATKQAQEQAQLSLLRDHNITTVILAKYMQILSDAFLTAFPNVINIHHSFLPAFVGGKPYHQAHTRGVKLIGATAHFATPTLDAGPIIEQDVVRVSHRDTVEDLVRKGRDVERVVLARAVRLHLLNRVLTYGNKTVVFE